MDTVIWQILVLLILIVLNAFFAASEAAMTSLNEAKLRRQSEEGDAKAKKMLRMVEDSAGFLSTVQLCITLVGFLSAAFAANGFSGMLTNWLVNTCKITAVPVSVLATLSIIFITLVLSFFVIVLGNSVPKRIAMRNPEKHAKGTFGLLSCLYGVMTPLVWLLSVTTNGILRLFGIDPNESYEDVSEEDILDLVGESEGDGVNVVIGSEGGVKVINNSTVVFKPIKRGDRTVGVVGVIGPLRMDYARVLTTLDNLGANITHLLNEPKLLDKGE